MIVGKMNSATYSSSEVLSEWKASTGVELPVCSVVSCRELASEGMQVKLYGISDTLLVPTCPRCSQSHSNLTDLKSDTHIVIAEESFNLAS